MKIKSLILFISLGLCSCQASGQQNPQSVQDSIAVFYDGLFKELETGYLKREEVDWKTVKEETLKNASQAESFMASLQYASDLFDKIGCNHCSLFADNGMPLAKSSLNKELTQEDFNKEFLTRLQDNSGYEFNVQKLEGNTGYINMPGMLLINLSQDSLNLKAQEMYDEIIQLQEKENITSWVLDLRFNSGGNAYVMLAALYHFLGDNLAYQSLDAHGKLTSKTELNEGKVTSGGELKVEVKATIKPDLKVPVALIIGKLTGSAGEDLAVAFKNREAVITVGEPSYGFLTGNDMFDLPFDTQAALTLSYIVDMNKKYREFITPDVEVVKQDNFSDLTKDGNIVQALKFLNGYTK